MIKIAIRIFIGISLVFLIQGCARIGRPTGGIIDRVPPSYVSSEPKFRSSHFDDDEIRILFDEYIMLKDPTQQVSISPPTKKKPLVRELEKSIRISFDEPLAENTTYTINFGKAIADLNEGNGLPDFEFVFSTGDVVDSLSVTGKVIDAFTSKEDKKAQFNVMLYKNSNDSAPFVELPQYFGKANEFGLFAVNNIAPGSYKVIALEDINHNLLYDKGLERMAFLDSLLVINAGNVVKETFIKDTIRIIIPPSKPTRKDTARIKADTIIAGEKSLNAQKIALYYFLENESRIYLNSYKRTSKEAFSFKFNRPLYKPLEITPLNFQPDSNWFLTERQEESDSTVYWITDTTIARMDTINLKVAYLTKDSTDAFITQIDTISLKNPVVSARANRTSQRRLRNEAKPEIRKVAELFSDLRSGDILEFNQSVGISSPKPLKNIDPEHIELVMEADTVFVPQSFQVIRDTMSIHKFAVSASWEEGSRYKLLIKPDAVHDIYGVTNDSLELAFTVRPIDYYGTILLNFSSTNYPMIIQLMDSKSVIVRSYTVKEAGKVVFDFIKPGSYDFKAIYDSNGNNKWDTGDYLHGVQPEKIFITDIPQQLRSNWDVDLGWNITFNGTIGK